MSAAYPVRTPLLYWAVVGALVVLGVAGLVVALAALVYGAGPGLTALAALLALLPIIYIATTGEYRVAGAILLAPGEVTVRNGTDKVPAPEATFVTWTLSEESPFYCVEPWMGPANSPEHQVGLHWVAPGASQSFVVEVAVK